jgi:hypothetical protein
MGECEWVDGSGQEDWTALTILGSEKMHILNATDSEDGESVSACLVGCGPWPHPQLHSTPPLRIGGGSCASLYNPVLGLGVLRSRLS